MNEVRHGHDIPDMYSPQHIEQIILRSSPGLLRVAFNITGSIKCSKIDGIPLTI